MRGGGGGGGGGVFFYNRLFLCVPRFFTYVVITTYSQR